MKKLIFSVLLFIGALSGSVQLLAHHSFSATFKDDAKITVEGVVTRFSFRNPHVLVYLDVSNPDGSTTEWVSEGAAATLLRRAGWPNDALKPGDRIQVTGDSTHDGSPMVSIDKIDILGAGGSVASTLLPNSGQRAAPSSETPKAAAMPLELADGKPNLTGAWTNHGMANGRPRAPEFTFTEIGQAVQDTFVLENDPQVFCDPPGLPRQAGTTPHPIRITQLDDRIIFEYEEYGGRREVFFDDRAHLGIPTHLGDSTARYEGDTLIVETINLLPNNIYGNGAKTSSEATIKEVYSRVDNDTYGPIVNLDMYLTDPVNFTEVIIMSREKMSAGADYDFIENDCHAPLRERTEVNAAMNFFLTSEGLGDGANLGGLSGADAHCSALAATVGQGDKNWVAYLSTTGENGVNAIDRIGNGPWYNSDGVPIATDKAQLHGDAPLFTKETVLSERGASINGRGDTPNRHDVLTGSDMQGMAVNSDSDTTCSNWTSSSENGSALIGHFDRVGGGDNPESWNSAHGSRGCSQENLQGTGGDGLFYCFATD